MRKVNKISNKLLNSIILKNFQRTRNLCIKNYYRKYNKFEIIFRNA